MKRNRLLLLMAAAMSFTLVLHSVSADTDVTRPEVRYLGTMSCKEALPSNLEGVRLFKLCDGETKVIIAADGTEPGRPMARPIAPLRIAPTSTDRKSVV